MINDLPSVSFLIPTLNAGTFLNGCLKSIAVQNYPKNKVEIIIADGGSTDDTLNIAHRFKANVIVNPLKTAEAGKAVALKKSKNDLIALVDSDNILPQEDWLRIMVKPFTDKNVIGSEPWEYTWRQNDGFIDRYCAMMGLNDPICFFLDNYDRKNTITGKWTGLKLDQKDKGEWIEVILKSAEFVPTIGANGTLLRRKLIQKINNNEDYFFDVDLLMELVNKQTVTFAKVKTGIVHLYCGKNINRFIRKQKRRITDYLYFQKLGARTYPWIKKGKIGICKYIISCITIVPLVFQSLLGYSQKKDSAWVFHPLACWITLFIYSAACIKSIMKPLEIKRNGWKQ